MFTRKCPSGFFFLRKLKYFNIGKKLLNLFYTSVIESVLLFCFSCWGGNCRDDDLSKFNSIIRKASKLGQQSFSYSAELLEKVTLKKVKKIIKDKCHPLSTQIIPSRLRSGRFIYLKTLRERYRNSFLPRAIRLVSK